MILKDKDFTLCSPADCSVMVSLIYPLFLKFSSEFKTIIVPKPFVKFVRKMCGKQIKNKPSIVKVPCVNVSVPKRKNMIMLFDGSDESIYNAVKFRDEGYSVELFIVNFLDKETEVLMENEGFKLLRSRIVPDSYSENPLHLHLIASMMLDYCLDNGIRRFSFGKKIDGKHLMKTFMQGVNAMSNFKWVKCKSVGSKKLRKFFVRFCEGKK